jgi:DNA polymerase-1
VTRTLLIDADIIAYQSSAANERKYDWGDGVTSRVADLTAAKRAARDEVDHLMDKLKATNLIICLSDDVQNFRKKVYPAYKENRSGSERPEHLYDIKEWLGQKYPTDLRPWLEADDVMGILSTEPHTGERIIVSADKDMQTIPGLLFNPNKDTKVRTITRAAAERFLLWQVLTGDQTDGYPGCPGCGPKTADEILDHLKAWVPTHWEITRGKRKGTIETKWNLEPSELGDWDRVVSAYTKAGQGPKDATVQANLARILKHEDMDGNRVIPWVPAMLSKGGN